DLFFQARDENNPARMMYATSNFATGNTRGSIFSVAMDKLQIFTLEPNSKVTGFNSLDLMEIGFGDKPIALFIATPDSDKSNEVLASILISQLYRVNSEKATKNKNGKMKRHVHFLLDEFGNMPTIEGMAGMVTVGAGRGFRYHLIIQAYSQVKSMYGEESDTIIGNCSNQIYILTEDKSTAEHYSSMLGTRTITDVSRSGELHSFDKSHSESTKERALLTSDELMRLQEGQSVVIRVNKRQDTKRRKIEPKPIFNKVQTKQKFRYEYLANDFDTSKSILSLQIVYDVMNLNDIVYSAKVRDDLYLRMADVMESDDFIRLKRNLMQVEELAQKDRSALQQQMLEVEEWSFLHYLSYLVYHSNLEALHLKLMEQLNKYLPQDIMTGWQEKINERMERKLELRKREKESEQEDEETEEEALIQKAISAN